MLGSGRADKLNEKELLPDFLTGFFVGLLGDTRPTGDGTRCRGRKVLRDGGRLAFITSGSWVRGDFGGPLRKYLVNNATLDSLIDFGEFQPFEDVELIRPTIAVLKKRRELQTKVQRRLVQAFGRDTAGVPLGPLNQKPRDWRSLSLNELGQALKTSFQLAGNPFKTPRAADEWEPYLAEHGREIDRLTRALADAESELNDRVYHLFALTPEEIQLLQREVAS